MTFTSTMWESQCVKITQSQPYAKQHIIENVYRPPFEGSDDFDLFLHEFNDFVNIMSSYGHSCYICGDFNINLLKINTKPHYNNFFKNMLSAGFFPKITLPTRICDTSSTLIDNIYSNDLKSNDISGIFVSHISDHQAIFTTTNTLLNKGMDNKYIILETKNDISLNNFVQELRENNITEQINNDTNANSTDNYKIFLAIIQGAKNKNLPTKKVKFNKYKHKKNKWITRGILKSIKTKNVIYKQLQQTKPENTEEFETLKVRFKRFHKILCQSIQEAKRTYYLTTFERFKHDIRRHGLSSMINYNVKKMICQVSFLTKERC